MPVRTLGQEKAVFSIWDNFEGHAAYLRGVGATEAQIETLRAAAQAVADAEAEDVRSASEADSLAEITTPTPVPLGSQVREIAPPAVAARYWAGIGVAVLAGGRRQMSELEYFHTVVAGLLVLWAWGNGKRQLAMRSAQDGDELAGLVGQVLSEAPDAWDQREALTDAYLRLMGVRPAAVKKKRALATYEDLAQTLRRTCAPPSTAPRDS